MRPDLHLKIAQTQFLFFDHILICANLCLVQLPGHVVESLINPYEFFRVVPQRDLIESVPGIDFLYSGVQYLKRLHYVLSDKAGKERDQRNCRNGYQQESNQEKTSRPGQKSARQNKAQTIRGRV